MNRSGLTAAIVPLFLCIPFLLLSACSPDERQVDEGFQYQARLQPFDGCDSLGQYLVETAQTRQRLVEYLGIDDLTSEVVDEPAFANEEISGATDVSADDSSTIEQVTGTNNQVAGVDESDFVKTDGEYTYILNRGYLLIFDTWPAQDSRELSRVELKGYPGHLFVHGDTLWVASKVYDYRLLDQLDDFAPRVSTLTQVSLFDISDKQAPQLIREIALEGSFNSARMIDNQVHMVTSAYFDIYSLLEDDTTPALEELLPLMFDTDHSVATATTSKQVISDCASIYRPDTANGTGTVSLFSFDLDAPLGDIERQTIVSNSGIVYANQQSLYVASVEDRIWVWLPMLENESRPRPGTTIHKFNLQGTPKYSASGRVDGQILNQFAMDEHEDLLRMVTTESARWDDGDPRNTLYILQDNNAGTLDTRSSLEGLGKPGERVYAARFMQDKGFVVTFERIDPLYTLDLSDPDNPAVAGTLEVPGFSTYLHPIADDLILAIGRDVDNDSVDLSLFDTTDFNNPALLHRTSVGKGSFSEALYHHKAFTWFADEKLLALPFIFWTGSLDGPYSEYELFNGLQIYHVDQQGGFELAGEVDHSNFFRNETERSWYYPEMIRRSFFVSDTEENSFLYSISGRGLKINPVDDLANDLAALPLPH